MNLARRRAPKPHVTIKYLEADFAALFVAALAGLGPDGQPDARYRGRELARNAAIARLVLSSGLRRQEFTYLLAYEIPALPASASELPVPFGVPAGVTKGRKYRTTWIDLHGAGGRAPLYRPGPGGQHDGFVVAAAGPVGRAAGGE